MFCIYITLPITILCNLNVDNDNYFVNQTRPSKLQTIV